MKSRPLGGGLVVGREDRVGEWGRAYRTSHRRPSAATCFFVLSSFRTRDWRDVEEVGAASWRSRTFFWGRGQPRGGGGGAWGWLGGGNLDVAEHVVFDGREGYGAELV